MDLLLTKYLKAEISYEGIQRVETYPFPEEALREAVLNAVAHKDYSSGVPIQISVYENKVIIWNTGQLPENWTIEKLKQHHPSVPYNPGIANAFFRTGLIESWGRGILMIMDECRRAGVPVPGFRYEMSGFWVVFERASTGQVPGKYRASTEQVRQLVIAMEGEMKRNELQELLALKHRDHFREAYLIPAIESGFVEPTIPDKPRSSKQKYRLTKQGLLLKNELEKKKA